MWLEELKQQNLLALGHTQATQEEPPPKTDHPQRTEKERQRINKGMQSLYEELAASVNHIDPGEYTENRIQGLLEQARMNDVGRKYCLDVMKM